MSSKVFPSHNPVSTRDTGDSKTALSEWKHVGYYGSCLIYARDNKRRLVDPETGQTTFEYVMSIMGLERNENIDEIVVTRSWKGRGK